MREKEKTETSNKHLNCAFVSNSRFRRCRESLKAERRASIKAEKKSQRKATPKKTLSIESRRAICSLPYSALMNGPSTAVDMQ